MNSSPLRLTLVTLALLSSAGARAQAPAPTPPPERPVVEVSGPSERLSRSTLSAVSAGITYQPPPPPKPVEKKPEPAEEEDAPKNGIIRLPQYIVEGDRPPVFRPRDINTKKGLGQIAVDRYFSETGKALNRFTIPIFGMSKEQYALMMWEEEERLQNMKNASENVYLLRQSDPAAAAQLKREVDQTFIRRSEFSPVSNGRDK